MSRRTPPALSRGFTLVELVTAMASSAILMGAIASTMVIAMRASNPANTPAAGMLEALKCMADMSADLQYTLAVTGATAKSITVSVPDRGDADTAPDTLTYAWSGIVGEPVTRQYNGGAAVTVLSGVHSFALDFHPTPATSANWLTVRIQPTSSTLSTAGICISLLNR